MSRERPAPSPLRAVSFDYWDTLYTGATLPERMHLRQAALRLMLEELGCPMPDEEFAPIYRASGEEAERWWRDEQRGYTTDERIRWILTRMGIERPADCNHVAKAIRAVDEALLTYPPPLLDGAADAISALSGRYMLAIVSDTGFASGTAQDALLEHNGIRREFSATVYSMDLGHSKPRREPFETAARRLQVPIAEMIHVGNDERTDIRGALDAGARAIRLDIVKQSGPSAAEFVARSFAELSDYLLAQRAPGAQERSVRDST